MFIAFLKLKKQFFKRTTRVNDWPTYGITQKIIPKGLCRLETLNAK